MDNKHTTYLDIGSIDINDIQITGASDIYDSTYDIDNIMSSNVGTITLNGATGNTSSYTISTGSYGYNGTWGAGSGSLSNNSGLKVAGDAEFDGDVKIKGKSLNEFLETLEKRLAILQPDPRKLEKFEALKKAYNHYKMLEALCDIEEGDDKQ